MVSRTDCIASCAVHCVQVEAEVQILAQDVAHNSRPQPPAPGSVAAAMAAKRAVAAAATPRLTEVQHKEHVAEHLTEVQKEWPNGDIPPGETHYITFSSDTNDSLVSVADRGGTFCLPCFGS